MGNQHQKIMNCPKCGSEKVWKQKNITYKNGTKGETFQCGDCKKYFTIKEGQEPKPAEPIKANGKRGVSMDEIIKTHDVEILIKEGLRKLEKGQLLTESDFVDMANLRGKMYRTYLEQPDMKAYKGKIDGTMYYGIPSDIEILRQKYIMR